MGKKVKKAFKSATKSVTKAVTGVVGGSVKEPKAPDIPDPIPPAVVVAAPEDVADVETGSDTESGKRKTQSGGKNKLTVARSSGRGLNI